MWVLVLVASVFEVGWATGLKHANSPVEWVLTIIGAIVSFALLLYASRSLPTSTVYAVFVALGTVGTVVTDFVFFHSPLNRWMIFFLLLLLVGVLGLKLATGKQDVEGRQQE